MQRTLRNDTWVNSGTWRMLAWIGVALEAAALIFVLWSERWGGAATIAVFLVLSSAFLLMQDRLPSLFSFLVVLAALINAGGWAWNWYDQIVWFDEVVHAFTSFAVISAIAHVGWRRAWMDAAPGTARFVLWAAVAGLGVGIAWEVFESLFLNLTFWDTVVDLVMDTVGAALAGLFAGWVIRKEQPRRAG